MQDWLWWEEFWSGHTWGADSPFQALDQAGWVEGERLFRSAGQEGDWDVPQGEGSRAVFAEALASRCWGSEPSGCLKKSVAEGLCAVEQVPSAAEGGEQLSTPAWEGSSPLPAGFALEDSARTLLSAVPVAAVTLLALRPVPMCLLIFILLPSSSSHVGGLGTLLGPLNFCLSSFSSVTFKQAHKPLVSPSHPVVSVTWSLCWPFRAGGSCAAPVPFPSTRTRSSHRCLVRTGPSALESRQSLRLMGKQRSRSKRTLR